MKRSLTAIAAAALTLALSAPGWAAPAATASPRAQERADRADRAHRDDSKPMVIYTATLVDTTHVLPMAASVPVKVWLDRFTTDDEAAHLADLAKVRSEQAFRQALQEDFVGRLEIDGRFTDPIAYARRIEDDNGTHLMLIAQRALSIREIFSSWPSRDYPFTVLQLDIDRDGNGSGTIYLAAKIRPRKSGEIELVGYDFLPSRLMAVQRLSGSLSAGG